MEAIFHTLDGLIAVDDLPWMTEPLLEIHRNSFGHPVFDRFKGCIFEKPLGKRIYKLDGFTESGKPRYREQTPWTPEDS